MAIRNTNMRSVSEFFQFWDNNPSKYKKGKHPDACDMTKYGEKRLELGIKVKEVLDTLEPAVKFFLDSGTLLGAWRSSKQLTHDDDFDMCILHEDSDTVYEELERIQDAMQSAGLYSRIIDTYCFKVEVFDPVDGKYILPGEMYAGADYHYITVDLQMLTMYNGRVRSVYPNEMVFNRSDFAGSARCVDLEGYTFPAPRGTSEVLAVMYGYLGEDAEYDEKCGKYRKKTLPSSK